MSNSTPTRKPVPRHVWRARAIVNKAIKEAAMEYRPCPRCGGEGYMDREDWIETEADGAKACFNCKGSGEAKPRRFADPLKVRYATVYRLLPAVEQGDFDKIMKEEDRAKEDIYWPILEDVYRRALAAAERIAGV